MSNSPINGHKVLQVRHGWRWLDTIVGPLDADFEAAVLQQSPAQVRRELDALFRS